jgi:hypothetical protein
MELGSFRLRGNPHIVKKLHRDLSGIHLSCNLNLKQIPSDEKRLATILFN